MLNMLGRRWAASFSYRRLMPDKKEMTLDCLFFRTFSQPRVISVHSYYLTSLVTSLSLNWTSALFDQLHRYNFEGIFLFDLFMICLNY